MWILQSETVVTPFLPIPPDIFQRDFSCTFPIPPRPKSGNFTESKVTSNLASPRQARIARGIQKTISMPNTIFPSNGTKLVFNIFQQMSCKERLLLADFAHDKKRSETDGSRNGRGDRLNFS
jgi:hypothetical protein